jgi:membrane protein required for colicin V production
MNWLDVVILILVVGSMVGSAWKGFSREVAGLVSSIAALILALWFYGTAGSFFAPYTSTKGVANFLGFLVIFIAVLFVGSAVGWLLSRFMRNVGLSWMDRLLGAGFGVLRGLLFATALVMILMAFTPGPVAGAPPRSVVSSRFAPYVLEAARVVVAMAPHEVKAGFRDSYDRVKEMWQNAIRKGVRDLPAQEL